MVSGKRTGAAKSSRHTKKYMRKGTDVEDIIDAIHKEGREKATGGKIAELKDDEIFVVDREVNSDKIKFTKRQQAALDKIGRHVDKEMAALPFPKKPSGKIAKLPRGNASVKKVVKKPAAKKQSVDVWETDFTPKCDLAIPEAAEHFLRYTKKKMPNAPLKSVTSLLPAVEVAAAGASYNPEADEYIEYVSKIAKDEQKLIDKEERIQRGIKPQWEKVATEHERFLESAEGLHLHPNYYKEEEEEKEVTQKGGEESEEKFTAPSITGERLTKEQKKKKARAAEIELEEKKRLAAKAKTVDSHNVYRTKQITKELDEEDAEMEKKLADRKRNKVMTKMTKRQRLGRGKFEDAEDAFLLQDELSSSLRQMKPQGHVLDDRMKSLQRRNMLPIGGDKTKKLKKSLKRKIVEKRSVKEVTKGSRVI